MKTDAIRTRESVNANILNMGIDEIMANEAETKRKVLTAVSAIASAAALGAGAGITIPAATNAIKQSAGATAKALRNFKIDAPMDTVIEIVNTTDIGRAGEKAAETAIRTYSDVKAYVAAIYLDQTFKRLNQAGVPQEAGRLFGTAANTALDSIDQQKMTNLSNVTANSLMNIINAGSVGVTGKQLNNLSLDDQTAILMNDPNYRYLMSLMTK